jgi:hypothetical protein
MTIEQKPELNRFIDPSIPLTWGYRWHLIKVMLPAWLLFLAFIVELWLFKTWVAGRASWDDIFLLGIWLMAMFLVQGLIEVQIRLR